MSRFGISASRSEPSRFRFGRFLFGPGASFGSVAILGHVCLITLAVASRDRARRPADIVVGVILEVRERDADRPVRSGKAAAIEQDDSVFFGQPEYDVQRMHVFLHPRDDVLSYVLT